MLIKGSFRILFKRVDIPLRYMPNLVMACRCLHNMCITNSNGFDMDSTLEAQKEAQVKANSTFGNIKRGDLSKVVKKTIKHMKKL
jgi:hypothetical protein